MKREHKSWGELKYEIEQIGGRKDSDGTVNFVVFHHDSPAPSLKIMLGIVSHTSTGHDNQVLKVGRPVHHRRSFRTLILIEGAAP